MFNKKQLDRIENLLKEIQTEMATTNQGLTGLQAAVAKLQTDQAKLIADVQRLLANQTPGLQPGQVVVNQADIDALTATIGTLDTAATTEDAAIPPAPGA